MIFKVINAEFAEQVEALWDYCFEKKSDPFFQYYFNSYCFKQNIVFGGFERVGTREKLCTMVHINPYKLRIRGIEQQVPYLVGVATDPEARGQHLFAHLAQKIFDFIRFKGCAFVTLMPIYAGIYLPYQFSYCYYRHAYKMPLEALPRGLKSDALKIGHLDLDAIILMPLYNELTRPLNGVPIRSLEQWNKLLTVGKLENLQCAIVYRQEKPVAYMLYKIEKDVFDVLELLADASDSRNCLLAYASEHRSEASMFSWLALSDDKTYLLFENQNLSGSLHPFMMARCLDVRAALANLLLPENFPIEGITLKVTDKIIPINNCMIKLETGKGKLIVSDSKDTETISMDIGAFTQLFMGTFTASELHAAGKICCQYLEKLKILDMLFPKQVNYNNEYF